MSPRQHSNSMECFLLKRPSRVCNGGINPTNDRDRMVNDPCSARIGSVLVRICPEIASPSAPPTIPEYLADHNLTQADGELWYDDGNLIILSEDVAFRVYRGLLSKRSSVFGDMFEFPPPKEGNEIVEGVPIVRTWDSSLDMGRFLRAILDSEFFLPPPAPTSISLLESILRLSTKYNVPHLRSRATAHLLTTYPTTLATWRQRDSTRTIPSVENTPFVVLNLAREFDLPWLIPSVAYCISSHDIGKTLEGAEWKEGGEARIPVSDRHRAERDPSSMGSAGKDNWVYLSYADIKMCIKGRNNILMRQNTMALALAKGFPGSAPAVPTGVVTPPQVAMPQVVNQAPLGGTPPIQNPVGLAGMPGMPPVQAPAPLPLPQQAQGFAPPAQALNLRKALMEILTRWGTAGFLDFFDEQYNAFAPNLCSYCVGRMKEWCKEKSEEMWDGLPGCFGFEGGEDVHGLQTTPWEELQRLRELSVSA
ncbi:hypothetical protein FA13DRAFT_1712464 [Coprinellus micaceus]|uniref:BTB domain-containing protein n=1 Tax=Coprinellus micaceus TaxID=71717 RepID=A0A4Y7T0N4_COPMI|nr:hypothetical protein FA13DRAFT_1712464 [Coprinellus micaceus]